MYLETLIKAGKEAEKLRDENIELRNQVRRLSPGFYSGVTSSLGKDPYVADLQTEPCNFERSLVQALDQRDQAIQKAKELAWAQVQLKQLKEAARLAVLAKLNMNSTSITSADFSVRLKAFNEAFSALHNTVHSLACKESSGEN